MVHDFAQLTWDKQLEDDCRKIVRLAVREDLDRYLDWTTASLVDTEAHGEAHVVVRETGVISGLRAAELAIDEMQADLHMTLMQHDGQLVEAPSTVATLAGSARDLLTCERILLNLIGRLSGVATLTHEFVLAASGTQARVYDTRKTTPGWRRLEKYAVKTGGGHNHRSGLYAAIMIKDNHLAYSREHGLTAAQAVTRVRDFLLRSPAGKAPAGKAPAGKAPAADMIVEVEVDTFEQFIDVLAARPDIVLLDNMAPELLERCVEYRNAHTPEIELEASGGITLDTIAGIARTGVDRISVGALTHSAVSLDVGLDWKH